MDSRPRSATLGATLDAVLVGVLAIGTSLPFGPDGQEVLWSADPTTHAVATRFAVVALFVALLWGLLWPGGEPWHGLVQFVVGALTVLAAGFGTDLSTGGVLIRTTAVLTVVSGFGTVLAARRSARAGAAPR